MLKHITLWLDRLERLTTIFTGIVLGFLALLVGWQVIARYVFNTGLFWAEELALVAMMWASLFGAAGCLWTDSHVRLRFFLDWLPATGRVWLLTLMDAIIIWFAVLFTQGGLILVRRTMGGKMSALGISIGVTYYVLPVAAIMMILFVLVQAIKRLVNHYAPQGGTP